MVRKADWRINCTQVANRASKRHAVEKLRQKIPTDSYDFVRGGLKHLQGTYVDFDVGIDLCLKLGLDDLANQLLHERRTDIDRAVDVQQDLVVSPVLEDPTTVPVPSRLTDSDHNQNGAVAGQSQSMESPQPEDLMVTGHTTNEGSEENNHSLEEDDASSLYTDIAQLHAPRSNGSDDEVLSRPSNDDSERAEKRTSYYSYEDFERSSELEEVKLVLQAPSKTSSRYGSTTDISRSSWLAASDR